MPWIEVIPMNEKLRFMDDYRHNYFTVTEWCEHYNISRKTECKWMNDIYRLTLMDPKTDPEGPPLLQ